jgi:hypothetical protein
MTKPITEANLIIECVTNALLNGTKHFDERDLDKGIEEPVTDMKRIIELLRDGHLIIEPPRDENEDRKDQSQAAEDVG